MRIIDPRHRRETAFKLLDFIEQTQKACLAEAETKVSMPQIGHRSRFVFRLKRSIPNEARHKASLLNGVKSFFKQVANGRSAHEVTKYPNSSLGFSLRSTLGLRGKYKPLFYRPAASDVFCLTEKAEKVSIMTAWEDLKIIASLTNDVMHGPERSEIDHEVGREILEFVEEQCRQTHVPFMSRFLSKDKDYELIL